MRFGYLEFAVRDPGRSAAFYTRTLGFRVMSSEGPCVHVKKDGLAIRLRPGRPGGGQCVVLYADDPAAEARALVGRGVEVERCADAYTFRDPDGHEFQLVAPPPA